VSEAVTQTDESAGDLASRVAASHWYHTIDLPGGISTPGLFDTREAVSKLPLPQSLAGCRCLDVGTWDGFWAFEMERRGAASVTAIDLDDQDRWDWPPEERLAHERGGLAYIEQLKDEDRSFTIARQALGSSVERIDLSVYDLSSEQIGTFDFVFMGSLLLHLRDPVGALDRVRSICGGEAVIADCVDPVNSLLRRRVPLARLVGLEKPWWWIPNTAALRRMLQSAGFEVLETTSVYAVRHGPAHELGPAWKLLSGLSTVEGREAIVNRLYGGVPHAAFRVRPRRR
jgi:SAM-dependent methyltransferase